MKFLIILYFIVIAAMLAMVPVKLMTSVQSKCPQCGWSVFYSKRKKEFRCPRCGAEIVKKS